jgi:hypothetical protein
MSITRTDHVELIKAAGGELSYGINWTWAHFRDESAGRVVFEELCKDPEFEHRGFHQSSGDHLAAFRFR